MKVVTVIQARMTSTRLAGKVLRPIMGRPMLSYQLERLRKARHAGQLVLATTTNAEDDALAAFAEREAVDFVRGSERDVLSRYQLAASQFKADVVVRVTSDCPLLGAEVFDRVVGEFLSAADQVDYVSNMLEPTFPYGMAVEVMSGRILQEAAERATDPAEREHVTPYIYWRPTRFRLRSVTMKPDLSNHRWTVDTPEDFALASKLLESLYTRNPDFLIADVLALVRANPEWEDLNRHVRQRPATQHQGTQR